MSFVRFLLLLVSLSMFIVCIIVRYDILFIPLVAQIASNNEFELLLASYVLLVMAALLPSKRSSLREVQ
jgi:hypothetical protein